MSSSKLGMDEVLEFIRENGPVKRLAIAEHFDVTPLTISRRLEKLKLAGCEIINVHGKGYKLVDEPTTCDESRNHEGYPDPTAAKALANAMMSNGIKPEPRTVIYDELFKPGVVFQTQLGSRFIKMITVTVSGPFVYAFALDEHMGIVPTRLFSIDSRRAAVEGEVTNGSELMLAQARQAVAKLFGFEDLVEKGTQVEYELLKQKADIYEKAFYAVCGGKNHD